MILFFQSGRLGNQLFQYAALRTLAKDEPLVLVGFDELQSVFDGVRATFAGNTGSRLFRACERLRPWLNRAVPRVRLVSFIEEVPGSGTARMSRGLLGSPKYACTGYFQSEAAFDPAIPGELRIKADIAAAALPLLRDIRDAGSRPVFVHVRRGDYLHFPDARHPAVLPAAWYLQQMDGFRSRVENPRFVLLSDDAHYLHDVFGGMRDACIPDTRPDVAFAIMAACDGGILSASSFAWWGAWFAHRRNPEALFVAPTGWVGHRSGVWHPRHIRSSFLSYAATREER